MSDVWGKFGWGLLMFEGEFVAQLGSVLRLDDVGFVGKVTICKFGGVGKMMWFGVDNKLHLGFEGGFASGDQWDNLLQGNTNIAFQNQLGGLGDDMLI